MKPTLAKLKNVVFMGRTRILWAERSLNEYTERIKKEYPELARRGTPHATKKTNDPFHASVVLRRDKNFKGTGLSVHIYPDGTVVPSKSEFPILQTTPATIEEVGEENSDWLNPRFVMIWQSSNETFAARWSEGKAKAGSSKGSSSNQHESGEQDASTSSRSKGKAADSC
ncbi:hypothetical protein GGR55DRAFT_681280 [Xylaria sp. FL0064]|nr:hypothetical protein GGR55DRAFT_681280 [Xylaria sp. FL0064]